jgi:tetratricopeptide (TPR) repeat protein
MSPRQYVVSALRRTWSGPATAGHYVRSSRAIHGIIIAAGSMLALAKTPALAAGQAPDPNTDFLRPLAQFSLSLDGTFGDEGRSVRSSLESMKRALEEWDAAIRTSEAAMNAEVVRAEPRAAAAMHAVLGGAYLDRGRIADALREFTTATQLDASRPEIYTLQGLVYSQGANDDAAATEAFRKASALDPRNPVRWYMLARHLQKTGTPEETRSTRQAFQQSWEQGAVGKGRTAIAPPFGRLGLLQEKARVEPFLPPVLYAEGFALLQRGDFKAAIAQFAEATASDPLAASPVDRTEAMGQAAAAFRDGSIDAAVRHLRVAIELEPARAEAHRILGGVYLANQQADEAIDELKTAAQLAPADERTLLALANAFVQTGRYPEAEQSLRHIIEALPASGRAHYMLGRLYQRQSDYEKALRQFEMTITFHPLLGLNGIYQSMGAINAALQNFDAAVDAYSSRVDVHPNDPDAHQELGETYLRLGRHDEALVEFAMTLMLATGRADAYAGMAQVHLKEGRYADAVESSRRSLDLDADHRQARYALATSLLRLGRTDEGQKELETFQRLQAEDAAAHSRDLELGALKREASESSANGDHEKAVSLFRKALVLEPNAAVSHLNLGLALLYAGRPADAIASFKSAAALNAPPDVHRLLAQAYAALGQDDESRREVALYEQMKQESLRRAGGDR